MPPGSQEVRDDGLIEDSIEEYDPLREGLYLKCDEAEGDIFDTDEVWLLTWTPAPWKYPSNDCIEQFKMSLFWILKLIPLCWKTFCITPELSEAGNIHWHGWFVMKDKIKYYRQLLPRIRALGYEKIRKARNVKKALSKEYHRKSLKFMVQLLDQDLPITHLNIDKYLMKWRLIKARHKQIKYVPRIVPITNFIKCKK